MYKKKIQFLIILSFFSPLFLIGENFKLDSFFTAEEGEIWLLDESSGKEVDFYLENLESEYLSSMDALDSFNSYKEKLEERRELDLKGGMMVLGGLLTLAVGGASFYLSDYFYQEYGKAESTQEAIKYRQLTKMSDVFKFLFTGGGAGIAFSSAYYFTQGEDMSSLIIEEIFDEKKEGFYLVR